MAKIVIIGGGVAGLTAGIYARLNGYDAVVCEAHSVAGGNLTGWERRGYTIDNCIHWLTGTNPNVKEYKDWQEVGALGEVEIIQPNTLYTCEYLGKRLSVKRDLDDMEREWIALSLDDKKEITDLFRAVRFIQGLMGIAGQNHDKKYNLRQKIKGAPLLIKYFGLSNTQLARRFKSSLITSTIQCFLGEDFSSLAFIIVLATFCGDNGGLPRGGSIAMAERMVSRFLSLGGNLLLNCKVEKVNLENGKATGVTLANGDVISADYVVSTCEPKSFFGKILDVQMPKQLVRKYSNPNLKRFSSYQCAFSCEVDKLPFEGDFMFELSPEEQSKLNTKHLILREFSHENDFAPQGKSIIQSLIFCTEKGAKEFINLYSDKREYRQKKMFLADLICDIIIKKFPSLLGKIECIDVWTPATYKRFVGSEIGSWMSFTFPKNYLPQKVEPTVSGVENVILATQWLQPPGGLPIALSLGKNAVKVILEKEKKLAKIELKLRRKNKAFA